MPRPTAHGWLIGWFANAIMRGFDEEVRRALEFFDKSEWDPEDEQREMQGNVDACCAAAREWLRLREQHAHTPSSEATHHPACTRSFDARDWARDFRETARSLGYCDMDEGWLIGWFANAIMRGFDEAERRREQPVPDVQAQDAMREVFDATRRLCRDIVIDVGPEDDGTRDEMLTRLDEMQELWPLAEAVSVQAQIDAAKQTIRILEGKLAAAEGMLDAAVERERGRVIGIFVGELQKLHEKTVLDCGDNSCLFATRRGGMRTNGGCRCIERLLDAAVAREREEVQAHAPLYLEWVKEGALSADDALERLVIWLRARSAKG